MSAHIVNITEKAKTHIRRTLIDLDKEYLVFGLKGGGCAGFNYGFTFDEEVNEDDFKIPVGEFNVLIDSMSMTYLDGAEIDYKEELMGSSFVIKNPNAQTTCGCGSSFSV